MTRYLLLALLLTGCAYSPKETMEQGQRSVHQLKLPPERAASCMIRNVGNHNPGLVPSNVSLEDGTQEVIVRMPGYAFVPVMAHIRPKGSGIEATVWLTPNPMLGKDSLPGILVAGC